MGIILRFERLRNRGSKLNNLQCLKIGDIQIPQYYKFTIDAIFSHFFEKKENNNNSKKKHKVVYDYSSQNGSKIISKLLGFSF